MFKIISNAVSIKHAFVTIVLFSCLLLNGCASIALSFREHKDEAIQSNIYIGTRAEYKTITFQRYDAEKGGLLANWVVWPFALIDLPLCLIVDTLLLPYTLFTIKEPDKGEEEYLGLP